MNDCYLVRRGGSGVITAICAESIENTYGAAEGMLCIIGDIIPKIVYVTNEEPASPVNGDLWVQTGAISAAPIQAGFITVYPTVVKQYQSGEWKSVTCYVYHNGEWIPLEVWLFQTGNAFGEITGGWKTYGAQSHTSANDVENMVEGKNLVITIGVTYGTKDEGKQFSIAIGTVDKIAVGKYKRMYVTIGQTYVSELSVGFARAINNGYSPVYDGSILRPSGSARTYELDLSALGDDYEGYLFISAKSAYASRKTDTITISDIRLTN